MIKKITSYKLSSFSFILGQKKEVVNYLIKNIKAKKSFSVLPCSLNDLASVDLNQELNSAYKKIDFCTTDGMPLVWYFSFKTNTTVERVYGPHLTLDILNQTQGKSYRHFFYGSSLSTLKDLQKQLKKQFPHLHIVGSISPPFKDLSVKEKQTFLAHIKKTKPNCLWIGISSPKQVLLASEWQKALPHVAIFCVGAAFDFIALKQPMAPKWMQQSGLEWLFRLATNPKRLSYRYLLSIPYFLLRVFLRSLLSRFAT